MDQGRMGKPRIGILGPGKGPHVNLLAQALKSRGAKVEVLPVTSSTSFIPGRPPALRDHPGPRRAWAGALAWNTRPDLKVEDLDALLVRSLPRGSLEQVIYRVDGLHRLEGLGLPIINSPSTLEKTVDKFYTSALLADAGLPVPQTVVTESYDQAMEAVKRLGTVVVKPLFGSLGLGMVAVSDLDVAHRVFRALELGRYVYYLQEFLPHQNQDFRLLVVGSQVIAAMRRQNQSWKTNIACGGKAQPVEPDPELARLALRAAEILKADYLGIDILISEDQPYILEANGIPGWTGLQSVTSIDIAGAIADHVLAIAQRARNKPQPQSQRRRKTSHE